MTYFVKDKVAVFKEALIIKRKRSAEVIPVAKVQLFEVVGISTQSKYRHLKLSKQNDYVSPRNKI